MIAFLTGSPAMGQDHTRLNPANGLLAERKKVMPRPHSQSSSSPSPNPCKNKGFSGLYKAPEL